MNQIEILELKKYNTEDIIHYMGLVVDGLKEKRMD